jgi:energy-coupling factor transporter ATP-binding protein EcfA2
LEWVLDLEVSFLSGGQDLLLGLAMIRLMDADLVLLDEPADGLDLRNRDLTLAFVRAMQDEGKSIILIEQVLPVLFGCASRVAVIRGKNDPADSHYLQNTLAPLTEKQVEEIRGSILADELDRTLSLLDLLAPLR